MTTSPPSTAPSEALIKDLLCALDNLSGYHPGFRPAHAKGLFLSGTFTPTPAAAELTQAAHMTRPSTPVLVRLSDFAGVPTVPDNDPNGAGPRGMAIRFYLAEHIHTDIVAHSHDGFPVRTGEDFLAFARALSSSGPSAPKPTPLDLFLGAHPQTLRFATAPKPIPTSFARESFFAVSAFRFTNAKGAGRFGRYRIRPDAGGEYLSAEEAAKKSPNFLMEEIPKRLAAGPIKYHIFAQLADAGDVVDDATVAWPADRKETELGTITLTQMANGQDPEIRKIIFDPIPRLEGIAPSDDPLFEVRAAIYIMSGRRRRAAGASPRT